MDQDEWSWYARMFFGRHTYYSLFFDRKTNISSALWILHDRAIILKYGSARSMLRLIKLQVREGGAGFLPILG